MPLFEMFMELELPGTFAAELLSDHETASDKQITSLALF
jgi:hypothetical protein